MKSKKIIIKNKKAMPVIIMSFLYDLLFVAVTIFALLSFIKTIDSGMHLWRMRYADDLSTTLTLIEGMPDNVSVTYGQKHTRFLSDAPVELFLNVKDGLLAVSAISDPSQKTERQYIIQKDSELEIQSPLQSFTIVKTPDYSKISADETGCEILVADFKNLIETSVFFNINTYEKNSVKDDFETLIEKLKSDIELEYNSRLSSYLSLRQILYNKNIRTASYNSNIVFEFAEKRGDTDTIKVLYSDKGNALLAKQLACFTKKYLEFNYDSLFEVQSTNIPNNLVNLNYGTDTAVVLIQFETKDDFTLLHTQAEVNQVSMLLTKIIFNLAGRYTEADLARLRLAEGLN